MRISDSKRVLLFQVYPVWRSREIDTRLPLGPLYMGGSLRRNGYGVEVYHLWDDEVDATLSGLCLDDVLFVAVCSVLTGLSLRSAIAFSKKIKARYPDLPVVWGGVQPSAIPEICLKEPFVDAVGIGEGEELIVDIARTFNGQMEPGSVKGFAFKDDMGNIVINERRPMIPSLDGYAPDYSLLDLNRYIFNGWIVGLIQTSRGCPFNCAFCQNSVFHRGRWRKHSSEFVIEMLRDLRSKYDFRVFSFSDDNFWVDKNRAKDIIRGAYALGLTTFSIDIKINKITEDDVKFMAEHGVKTVFFGTESLNPRLISLIDKKQTPEQVEHGISLFAKHAPDVQVQTEILLALPFERESEMREDIRRGLDLYRHNPYFSLYFGVLFPLEGTKIMEYARANGFSCQSLYDYVNIDLTMVWSLADQWTLWDLTDKGKERLRLTEAYSELLEGDGRKTYTGRRSYLVWLWRRALLKVAMFRVRHQFFVLHKLDFWLYRNLPRGLAKLARRLVGAVRSVLLPFTRPSKTVCYRNFGYIPQGSVRRDPYGKVFGCPNLAKRLQARHIMGALNISPSDAVLDFGCGSGYFTAEIAKKARVACGFDLVSWLPVHPENSGLPTSLHFSRARGESLPFADDIFDVVLASEVLCMIEDPGLFMQEIRRVLKPGGRLVATQGMGHPSIRDAFQKRPPFFRWLERKYPQRMPASYDEYCAALTRSFGLPRSGFWAEEDFERVFENHGFSIVNKQYSPEYLSGAGVSWIQFIDYLRKGNTLSQRFFPLKYMALRLLACVSNGRYPGGLICVATNSKSA